MYVLKASLLIIVFREELALIENRILEKEMAAKRRAERLAKNIAVTFSQSHSFIEGHTIIVFLNTLIHFMDSLSCRSMVIQKGPKHFGMLTQMTRRRIY